jgi:hypothetical protein
MLGVKRPLPAWGKMAAEVSLGNHPATSSILLRCSRVTRATEKLPPIPRANRRSLPGLLPAWASTFSCRGHAHSLRVACLFDADSLRAA